MIEKRLGQSFTFGSLFKYSLPAIFTFVFMGVYQTIDGIFIDAYSGDIAIAAVTLQMPMNCLYVGLGNMIGTGGDAVISRKIGQKDIIGANRTFTNTLFLGLITGILCTTISLIFSEQIMVVLGASEGNIEFLRPYYTCLAIFAPAMLLQSQISVYFMTEGKTKLAAVLTLFGGITNFLLDWLLIVVFDMGISGAAIATGIGYSVTVIFAVWYYLIGKKSDLTIVRAKINVKELLSLCYNGSSEVLAEVNAGIATVMMNRTISELMGDNGISSLSVIVYFQLIALYAYIGFCVSVEPVFAFHFGDKNKIALRKNVLLSFKIITVLTVINMAVIYIFRYPAIGFFFNRGDPIYQLCLHGYDLLLIGCAFTGFTYLVTSFFTSMEKGTISLILSLLQGLVLFVLALMIMPRIMGNDGVWLAWPVAEFAALIISIGFFIIYSKKKGVFRNEPVKNSL